uniref:Uncharacterized protein n=1 Tax=Ananas comosus var. bracteatus TaxID=296719 RepID=A0A6V7P657_ANACO|nr:unnamed protein product [Ananas comosus var. bracteatus]
MRVEAVVPVPEFHFDGAAASPLVRPVAAHRDEPSLDGLIIPRPSFSTSSTVPFVWEDEPGAPKPARSDHRNADGDQLDFSFKFHTRHRANREALTAADELFAEGKIRPLKPPPRLQRPVIADELSSSVCSSPGSPWSPRRKAMRSPHRKGRGGGGGEEFDPFMAAMVETTKDKVESAFSISRSRKGSSTPNSSGKRWRQLKDLLLFRGAAAKMSKELILSKYSLVSLFKSRSPSTGPTTNKNTTPPHEKRNGVAQEVKKAAAAAAAPPPVPYRQRLLSCFRVNPAVHSVDGGFNRYSFSRMECE